MRVRYTATARVEADDIFARIANDNPAAAAAVASAISGAVARLRSFPHIGAATDEGGIHIKIVRPFHYLIFYSFDDDTVVIRNIRHPARRRPPNAGL